MNRDPVANIHGRKWGRGFRPWLLLPKYLCVSLLLGGLFATLVLTPVMPDAGGADARWRLIGRIYRYEIVPATLGSLVFGILLLLQHPRAFLRMRWMIVKLIMVLAVVPASHLQMSHELNLDYIVREYIAVKTVICLLAFGVITVLGRLKPRLGQPFRPA